MNKRITTWAIAFATTTAMSLGGASAADLSGMGGLSGKVTAAKPLALARVFALNKEKNVRYSVYAVKGEYRMTNMFPGTYEVTIGQEGLSGKPASVVVKAGDQAHADLTATDAKVETTYAGGQPYGAAKIEAYDKIYPAGPGRDILERTCMVCHGIQFFPYASENPGPGVRPQLDQDGWALFVDYMSGKEAWHIPGNVTMFDPALLPPADKDTLIKYLGQNFGLEAPSRLVMQTDQPKLDDAALSKAEWVEYMLPNTGSTKIRHSQQIDFRDGNLWITDRGRPWYIVKIDPRTGAHEDFVEPVGGGHGIAVDADGTVWYSGGGGAFAHFDPKSGLTDTYKVSGEPRLRSVTEIFDSKGDLWVGFLPAAKLAKWDRKTETISYYNTPNGRSRPYGVVVDHQDNVWYVGYMDSSLDRFDPKTETFTRFPITDKLTMMRRLGVDTKDTIWSATFGEIGGKGGSLVHLDPKTGKVQMWKMPILYANPYDTETDPNDKVWSTSDNYLVNFDPATEKFTLYPYPTRSDSPKMAITRTGAIWFPLRNAGEMGTYGGGATVLYPDKEKITELGAFYADNSVWGRVNRYKGPATKVTGVMKCSPRGAKNDPNPANRPPAGAVAKICEGADAKVNSVEAISKISD